MFEQLSKDQLFSAIRGLDLKEFSIREMEHLKDLFHIKSRQMDEEIRNRRNESRN